MPGDLQRLEGHTTTNPQIGRSHLTGPSRGGQIRHAVRVTVRMPPPPPGPVPANRETCARKTTLRRWPGDAPEERELRQNGSSCAMHARLIRGHAGLITTRSPAARWVTPAASSTTPRRRLDDVRKRGIGTSRRPSRDRGRGDSVRRLLAIRTSWHRPRWRGTSPTTRWSGRRLRSGRELASWSLDTLQK